MIMNMHENDALVLADEDDEEKDSSLDYWKVMIVDDEKEVHEVTQLALEGLVFQEKTIAFLSAYSAEEAKSLLKAHSDVALIFLDVVMEENDSGLKLVKYIRESLQNRFVRIILRTGQPGEAPEGSVIINYDINDYKLKLELTQNKLFAATISGLRCYRDLIILESNKVALKKMNEQLQHEIAERKKKEKELIAFNEASERFVPRQFLSMLGKQSVIEIQLGDQVEKEMSVLFSDIREFTFLSEEMTPQDNFNFINGYLSRMVPIIDKHQGVIDKYIGDAIMALFPNNADTAVQAALAMIKTLDEYNCSRGRPGRPVIKIGIGINTGKLMLGMVGGQNRMAGTVIADAVNLASRVENMTKMYDAALLISENTYSRLKEPSRYVIRPIGKIKVKGKLKAVMIYEICDSDPPNIIDLKKKTLAFLQDGLIHYSSKEFSLAKQCFKQMLKVYADDKVAQFYLKCCEQGKVDVLEFSI